MVIDIGPPLESQVERVTCSYENQSDRFHPFRPAIKPNANEKRGSKVKDLDTDQRQYFYLYRDRLKAFRERLIEVVQNDAEANALQIRPVPEVKENVKCVIIGTTVKHQTLRPSVLKELCDEIEEELQNVGSVSYVSDCDTIDLEDEYQVIKLTGHGIDVPKMCTGIPMAAMGFTSANGVFTVEKAFFALPGPQAPLKEAPFDKYVLFISGLEFTGASGQDGGKLIAAQIMANYITGLCGSVSDHKEFSSHIVRVVIAGNSIATSSADREFSRLARYITRNKAVPSVESMQHLDQFIAEFTPLVPVDLMPGENDPTNHMLPQAPMHKSMFPMAAKFPDMLNVCTNPYECAVDGCVIMGTAGQNIDDIKRNTTIDRSVYALREIYRWQHLCPTSPDTLDCIPFQEDPFLISPTKDWPCPHILFAGNQPNLEYKMMTGAQEQRTLLLSLPKFSQACMGALVSLRSLDVIPFDCNQFTA